MPVARFLVRRGRSIFAMLHRVTISRIERATCRRISIGCEAERSRGLVWSRSFEAGAYRETAGFVGLGKSFMQRKSFCYSSLSEAVAALQHESTPMVLSRFAPDPAAHVVVAVNEAAAALPSTPLLGEHPDRRRDRRWSAEIELDYLYRQLIERGHACQVLAFDDARLVELRVTRVAIDGDDAVYGFVQPKPVSGGG